MTSVSQNKGENMKWRNDLSARTRLRNQRDMSEARGWLDQASNSHADLAHMCIVMFCNGNSSSSRLRRGLRAIEGHRARILREMERPRLMGYTAPVAGILKVDRMIFDLRTRIEVTAAAEAVERALLLRV